MIRIPCPATFIRYTADNPPPPPTPFMVRRAMQLRGLDQKAVAR